MNGKILVRKKKGEPVKLPEPREGHVVGKGDPQDKSLEELNMFEVINAIKRKLHERQI